MENIEHFNKYFGIKFKISKDDYDKIDETLEKLCNPKLFFRYCTIGRRCYDIKCISTKYDKEEWGRLVKKLNKDVNKTKD